MCFGLIPAALSSLSSPLKCPSKSNCCAAASSSANFSGSPPLWLWVLDSLRECLLVVFDSPDSCLLSS